MLLFFDMGNANEKRSYLAALDGLIVVGIVYAGAVALMGLFDAVTLGYITDLTVGLPIDRLREVLPDEVDVQTATATAFVDVGFGYRLAWWVVQSGPYLFVMTGGLVLRQIVTSARSGDPFVVENVRRLRVVAVLLVAHELLALGRAPVGLLIQKHVGVEHATARGSGTLVMVALVLFALAEIWQRGVDLRDEQALTV